MMTQGRRYKLIACEILFGEIFHCAAQSHNIIDMVFMPKGLHDMGEAKMVALLQDELDKVEKDKYDAILLGYALCNNGIRGLQSHTLMVVPRAHDCITLLMGSKEKYNEYFTKNPGTYVKSPGWIERGEGTTLNAQSIPSQLGISGTYEDYVEQYGEENAKFFMETIGDWYKNYKKFTFIDTRVGDVQRYKDTTRKEAEKNGWEYEEISGDIILLDNLLNGDWAPEKFLTVPAGLKIQSAFDNDQIISC